VRLGVVSLLALTLMVGCDDGSTANTPDSDLAAPVNEGPVTGGGGSPGTLCQPGDADGTVTYSLDKLRNTGDQNAVIDDVAVNDLSGLEVVGNNVVPLSPHGGVAATPSYPPDPNIYRGAGFHWDQRAVVPGATIPAGGVYSVAVGVRLEDPATEGSFAHLRVTYQVGEDRYALETSTELIVPPVGEDCP
jgi:hypothetical protein